MKFSGELLRDLGNLNGVPLIWGVYKVNAIPEVQVTNTHMDQWGFQGIIIMWEILVILFFKGALARFGKSQWSSFASGVTSYYGE